MPFLAHRTASAPESVRADVEKIRIRNGRGSNLIRAFPARDASARARWTFGAAVRRTGALDHAWARSRRARVCGNARAGA